ncbi:hypothetical protein Tco_0914442, partial [Tanacetum coccineum]
FIIVFLSFNGYRRLERCHEYETERSKDDEVPRSPNSVFVTNFPESISPAFVKSCRVYGTDEGFLQDVNVSYIGGLCGYFSTHVRWIQAESDESHWCLNRVSTLFKTSEILSVRENKFLGDKEGVPHTAGCDWKSSQDIPVDSNKTFSGQNVVKSGGSVLDVMEDIIRVGQLWLINEGC